MSAVETNWRRMLFPVSSFNFLSSIIKELLELFKSTFKSFLISTSFDEAFGTTSRKRTHKIDKF